jgi:hypothetical protein
LDKEIFEKQFKSKREIKKFSKWRALTKNQNREEPNSKISIATVDSYSTKLALLSKI